jgi:hypothetical protein
VWVTGQGELWFGGEDHDRMDVLSERKSYEPGETALSGAHAFPPRHGAGGRGA